MRLSGDDQQAIRDLNEERLPDGPKHYTASGEDHLMGNKRPLTIPDQDRDQIRRIVIEGFKGFDVRVFLFGSQIKGNAHLGSDVDVAVLSSQPLPIGTLSQVREALEDSTVPQVVELVDLGQTDTSFRNAVIGDGEEWTD
ncbi:MAG: nucleotidyltransferase domain-containing protein [Gemmatimonadetes bacterium]|jgi:uncharacterized protein|nr:nucleotidyltransferase domain-containing protein [Gemmatimonadota bacterium]